MPDLSPVVEPGGFVQVQVLLVDAASVVAAVAVAVVAVAVAAVVVVALASEFAAVVVVDSAEFVVAEAVVELHSDVLSPAGTQSDPAGLGLPAGWWEKPHLRNWGSLLDLCSPHVPAGPDWVGEHMGHHQYWQQYVDLSCDCALVLVFYFALLCLEEHCCLAGLLLVLHGLADHCQH